MLLLENVLLEVIASFRSMTNVIRSGYRENGDKVSRREWPRYQNFGLGLDFWPRLLLRGQHFGLNLDRLVSFNI